MVLLPDPQFKFSLCCVALKCSYVAESKVCVIYILRGQTAFTFLKNFIYIKLITI